MVEASFGWQPGEVIMSFYPCPPDGEGRHNWLWYAANECRRRGYPAQAAAALLLAELHRTGPANPEKILATIRRVYADHSSALLAHSTRQAPLPKLKLSGGDQAIKALCALQLVPGQQNVGPEVFVSTVLGDAPFICLGESPSTCVTLKSPIDLGFVGRYKVVVPNPFSSLTGLNQDGRGSWRSLSQVLEVRHLVTEFDRSPIDEQAAAIVYLQQTFQFPLVAVVFSGSKSLHAWWSVGGRGPPEREFFMRFAVDRLGADPAMRSPVQPTRLPGVIRPETGRLQELVVFNH